MQTKPARGLFITGTDTGVGKTYVAALIARALIAAGQRVGVYKPAASGCRREGETLISDDAMTLWQAAGRPGRLEDVCPQQFAAPLAPHLAARLEGRELNGTQLRSGLEVWAGYDFVIIEGAGGLLSPLGDEEYVADLAGEFAYPLVIVAPNRVGVINQTLQTLVTATTFRDGLPVLGIILNDVFPPEHADPSRATNGSELAARSVPPVLAHVPWNARALPVPLDWLQI